MKKTNIIIFGTSEYSEYVYYTIKSEGKHNILAFTLSQKYLKDNVFCNLPVLPFEKLNEICGTSFQILITIGYKKMNEGRSLIYQKCKEFGYDVCTYISSRCVCDSNDIGEGCIIMPTAYIPPCTKLGKCNIVNMGTYITHTGIIGDFNWFAATIVMGGNIKMGNNCFIGMGCSIKNGITIGSNVFLGAHSYLSDNAEDGKAYFGSPAVNKRMLRSSIVIDFV